VSQTVTRQHLRGLLEELYKRLAKASNKLTSLKEEGQETRAHKTGKS